VIVDLKKKEFKESGTTTKEKLPIKVNMANLKILLGTELDCECKFRKETGPAI